MKDSYSERQNKYRPSCFTVLIQLCLYTWPAVCIFDVRNVKRARWKTCLSWANSPPESLHRSQQKSESIHPKACFKLNSATAREMNVTRPVLVFSLQLPQNSELILCRQRASVSRWLPYLSRTARATPHASSDKGLLHWSPHDTMSPFPRVPSPHFLPLLLSFFPSLASKWCDMTSFIPGAYIFMARSWAVGNGGATCTSVYSLQSKWLHAYCSSATLRGFWVRTGTGELKWSNVINWSNWLEEEQEIPPAKWTFMAMLSEAEALSH